MTKKWAFEALVEQAVRLQKIIESLTRHKNVVLVPLKDWSYGHKKIADFFYTMERIYIQNMGTQDIYNIGVYKAYSMTRVNMGTQDI